MLVDFYNMRVSPRSPVCCVMPVSQQQLYLDLSELTEDQIEVGLEAGVWGDPARPVVQRHLDNMKLGIEAAAAEQVDAARYAIDAAQRAADEARGSTFRATVAIIIATGAMVAAMAAAFVAFLALRGWA